MKTTTKAQLMFVPAICQDGGDENKGETFTDTQRTSPGGVVEAHHREGSECGPDATPALRRVTALDHASAHRDADVSAFQSRGDVRHACSASGNVNGSAFPDAALIDGSGTDQGPLGTSVESKPMKKYRRRMAKLLGDALDRGDNRMVRRGIKRLLKVVDAHAATCAGGVKAK